MSLWLTQIVLNSRHPVVQKALSDARIMHSHVMALVTSTRGAQPRLEAGVLYRIENSRSGPLLLVQTRPKPEVSELSEELGQAEVRDITPLLETLTPGAVLRYRITASPTRRIVAKDAQRGDRGAITPLWGVEAEEWWTRRASGAGLDIRTVISEHIGTIHGEKRKGSIVHHAAMRFSGVGVVTDAQRLVEALRGGIGRGKAYGCGLLSLAPARLA